MDVKHQDQVDLIKDTLKTCIDWMAKLQRDYKSLFLEGSILLIAQIIIKKEMNIRTRINTPSKRGSF